MNSSDIRQKFLDYFAKHQHSIVPSSPLIPANDPTLLFTNAGMVQFKETFLGQEQRGYTRATSSQRCVRAGGKHNDLDNVGYTARHHTFFEMLGNFSFGDYFKKEAIQFAWEFLTKELGLPEEKLWVTVFEDDQEAEDIWLKEMKVSAERFSRCGEKDNFWSMGDTGPCGPCTEIFYDHGPDVAGGPPGTPEEDGDRYIEIWNLVFMQYNRSSDGSMQPLPKPSVDTGMGLERIAAVMQGVHSNYDIDIFRHIITAIEKLLPQKTDDESSLNVIADHIRSCAFLIVDGVTPSNEGRGYVLRRIIRRAIRHGHKIGFKDAFFYQLVDALDDMMGDAFPELRKHKARVKKTLQREEKKFAETLAQGVKIFEQEIQKLSGNELPGDVIFKLYDTYGFPPDLTADMAREKNIQIDYAGFEKEMQAQRSKSQQAGQFDIDYNADVHIEGETEFTGYENTSDTGSVTALLTQQGEPVNELSDAQAGMVVLDRTPFYAESGGQIGDKGKLLFDGGEFTVHDTKKKGMVYLHMGELTKGVLKIGTHVDAEVDSSRQAIMLNHTATHLLHAALRRILGDQVLQKGSLVEADRLRFDYAYPEPLTRDEIVKVEQLVNQQIRANLTGNVRRMTPDEAMKEGALALFGEKYGKEVRVLNYGEFSMELCGGTHVKHTGEIGAFKIISETGIASGIRRIEAVTGDDAIALMQNQEAMLHEMASLLKTDSANVLSKLQQFITQRKDMEKEIDRLQQSLASGKSVNLAEQAKKVNDVDVLAAELPGVDVKTLRNTLDQLKQQLPKAVIVLASQKNGKVSLVAGVTDNCTDQVRAGDVLSHVAQQIDGKGGGRADMAQGGGNDPAALPGALESVFEFVEEKLS